MLGCATAQPNSLQVSIDTEEADAVLAILGNDAVSEADWQRLFSSRGFIRLKEREASLNRPFDEAQMRELIASGKLDEASLRRALTTWRDVDLSGAAKRALRYLPKGSVIRATIYPVIKPRDNSFVFDLGGDPAIFMFVREEPREKFENTIAHELHHIGLAAACRSSSSKNRAAEWLGAFGEGVAMLAAAGGPNVHPHAVSPREDRERWDRDVGRAGEDLRSVEAFLLDVANGKLDEDAQRKRAGEFFGVQGPWYTVGWVMATTIEKELGREALIDVLCDGPRMLETYNRAARGTSLPLWSDELLAKLR